MATVSRYHAAMKRLLILASVALACGGETTIDRGSGASAGTASGDVFVSCACPSC
jgi:hypothetical protein